MTQMEMNEIQKEILEKNRMLGSLRKEEQDHQFQKARIKGELDKLLLKYIRNLHYVQM